MDSLDTSGKILNMTKEHGVIRIAVAGHSGYFTVPDQFKENIATTFEDGADISFAYDRDLNIVSLK